MPALPARHADLWLLPRPLTRNDALLAFTTEEEQQRAADFASRQRQLEWLAGRALLRRCLSHYTGQAPLALHVDKTSQGKPFLAGDTAPAFNLSHGPQWIGCAVTGAGEIGLDIDSEKRRNRIDEIAARYFADEEQQALQQCADTQTRRRLFFRLWTLKEAYIKAIGETINSVRLRDIAFRIAPDGRAEALFASSGWQLHQQMLDGDSHIAIALHSALPVQIDLWRVDADNPVAEPRSFK